MMQKGKAKHGGSAPAPPRFIAFVYQGTKKGTTKAVPRKSCEPLGSLLSVDLSCAQAKRNYLTPFAAENPGRF
jgi:hypothetical protein